MANILVGVTGGIAAYKSCEVVSGFLATGHDVRVVMTDHAKNFITEMSLAVLSKHPVMHDMWVERKGSVDHIEAATWTDCLVVYPATANIIGKFANGIADDLLSTIFLALPSQKVKKFICPAMNNFMFINPIVQDNISKLNKFFHNPHLGLSYFPQNRKNIYQTLDGDLMFLGPVEGKLACGTTGLGKAISPREVVKIVNKEITNSSYAKGNSNDEVS